MRKNNYNSKYVLPENTGKLVMMQRLFTTVCIIAVILGVGIIGVLLVRFGKMAIASIPKETTVTETYIPIVSTEPVVTETTVMHSEILPEDELADAFWGPLPELPEDEVKIVTHNEVCGIYIGSCSALDRAIELCANSELNTVVIDLKTEWGLPWMSTNETAREIGYVWDAYDIDSVVERCHENGIKVIGRIVCFNDSTAAGHFPERSIQDAAGNTLKFRTEGSRPFLSPYNTDNWEYLISIGEEAASHGLDEIQFDYVRFPAGSTTSGEAPYYGPEDTTPPKSSAVNRFLQTARIRIQDTMGVPVSADIFGIVLTSAMDAKIIGQDFETLGLTGIDSCCPMAYPSHYALGTMLGGHTFEYPDKEPYLMVYSVLHESQDIYRQEGFTVVRPYLQAFTATYIGAGNYMEYDYDAINAQIKALHDLGIEEYILWDPACKYPDGTYDGDMSVVTD
ncbi:MAG: putative glycoside hydrolase [Saccharofermentans sp.]|nr:putative glycoside hydrolase [Saccharofermentans sp.]